VNPRPRHRGRLACGHLLAVSVLGVATVMVTATPAAAHSRAAVASSFESRILHEPAIDGLEWRMYAGGDLIEVTNRSTRELVVLGYEGEPFLRIGPTGVFENLNSPATYLNAERYGDVAVPPRADPAAPAAWARVSRKPTVAWHDHRVHWMSPRLPASVRADQGREQLVSEWEVPLRDGDRDLVLSGELWWVPGPAPWPWLLLALVVTVPALIGLPRRSGGLAAVLRPAAVTVLAVALLNTIHFVDELRAWPVATVDVLFGLLHTALFVGVGVLGAVMARGAPQGPVLSLGVASGAVLFHQGLLQLPMLTASQLPTVWPPALLRLAVALSLAQAVWVAVVVGSVLRTGAPESRRPPPAPPSSTELPVANSPPSVARELEVTTRRTS
jgi:hypothetical protein